MSATASGLPAQTWISFQWFFQKLWSPDFQFNIVTDIDIVKFGRFKERFSAGENIFEFFVDGVLFKILELTFNSTSWLTLASSNLVSSSSELWTATETLFSNLVAIAQICWYLDVWILVKLVWFDFGRSCNKRSWVQFVKVRSWIRWKSTKVNLWKFQWTQFEKSVGRSFCGVHSGYGQPRQPDSLQAKSPWTVMWNSPSGLIFRWMIFLNFPEPRLRCLDLMKIRRLYGAFLLSRHFDMGFL